MLTPYFLDTFVPGLMPLVQDDWQVNQPDLPEGDLQIRMSALHQPLADFVAATAVAKQRPVSIAGDCCTTLGVLAGLQRASINPTFIWLDAHGDFNTWETTPSGFLGGMPLAMAVGRGEQTMPQAVGLKPVPESDVILTDGRDLDPGEAAALADSAVVHLKNPADLLNHPLPDGPLYVHFDTDLLNPDDAPAMNYLAPGGPTAVQIQPILGRLANTGQITAVSLSSWNPELDVDGRSQQVVMELLQTLLYP